MIYDRQTLAEVCRIHAKRDEYKQRVEEAIQIAKKHYIKGKTYVSCSGGKDSLALLHLVATNIDSDVYVFHWDHGKWLMPRWIEQDILSCIYSVAKNVVVKSYSFGNMSPLSRIDYRRWYREFFATVDRLSSEMGFEVCFLGLRAEESHVRRKRVAKEYETRRNVKLVYPLRNWTWLDVWTYLVTNNIRYPRIYDIYAKLLGYDKVRLVTFFDKEFEGIGTLYIDNVILWRDRL